MLFTLLALVNGITVLLVAVSTARRADSGFAGYALAITVGALLGACDVWALYKCAAIIEHGAKKTSERPREWIVGVFYGAVVVWTGIGAVVTDRLISAILRLLS